MVLLNRQKAENCLLGWGDRLALDMRFDVNLWLRGWLVVIIEAEAIAEEVCSKGGLGTVDVVGFSSSPDELKALQSPRSDLAFGKRPFCPLSACFTGASSGPIATCFVDHVD